MMGTLHKLKIKEQFADEIIEGNKLFEVRKNDRAYQKGDTVRFHVLDGAGDNLRDYDGGTHQLEHYLYEITYVLSGWGIQPDYVVFGIKEVRNDTKE